MSASPPAATPSLDAPTSHLPPPAPAPSRGLSPGAKVGIGIAVVAIVIFAALALGLVPGIHLFGTKGGPTGPSSDSALQAAGPVASAHGAGALVLEAGVNSVTSFQFGMLAGNVSCPVHNGLSANLTVPAQTGNYSNGYAAMWLLIYYNVSAISESVIAVLSGTTYFLGSVSGALCVAPLPLQALPSHPVSSTTVAAALANDAAPFTSQHASADSVFALVQTQNMTAPAWAVAYTPCSFDPSNGTTTGPDHTQEFVGEVNGTTGSVVLGIVETNVNCSSASPIHSYTLGMAVLSAQAAAGRYAVTVGLAPTAGLTTDRFGLSVKNATSVVQSPASVPAACAYGAAVSSCTVATGWYAVLVGSGGTVLATYGSGSWGNLAPATTNVTLTGSMSLVVISNTLYDGSGYTLSAFSTSIDTVTGSVAL